MKPDTKNSFVKSFVCVSMWEFFVKMGMDSNNIHGNIFIVSSLDAMKD